MGFELVMAKLCAWGLCNRDALSPERSEGDVKPVELTLRHIIY